MQPFKQRKWKCGPLEVWECHFKDDSLKFVAVQWALVLEGTLVVVSEEVGKTVSLDMEKFEDSEQ